LESDPPNAAEALERRPPASPPLGRFKLRNEEIKAAGLDKLLSAPANLLAVCSAPPTELNAPDAALATEFIVDPKSKAINFSFCTLFS
jgi:hypothetical protein